MRREEGFFATINWGLMMKAIKTVKRRLCSIEPDFEGGENDEVDDSFVYYCYFDSEVNEASLTTFI